MSDKPKRVVFDRPHTHDGVRYNPGEQGDIRLKTARWLVERGDAHWARNSQPSTNEVSSDEPTHG